MYFVGIDIGSAFSKAAVSAGSKLISYHIIPSGGKYKLTADEVVTGALSLKSKKKINFNTGCAVFSETEALSRITEGAAVEDILAGIHRALAAKIQNLVERLGVEKDIALTGGGAKDIGLVRSIEETKGINTLVPEEPQIVAALGAALLAEDINSH